MGIESDHLVDDYLSRVGELAEQRRLPPDDRSRLVSTLRDEIERQRATHDEQSPTAVRGILGALGSPDEVVERAGGPGAAPPVPKPREEPAAEAVDWWRSDAPAGPVAPDPTEGLGGFVGGLERPDLFEPPAPPADAEPEDKPGTEPPGKRRRRRLARVLLRRRAGDGDQAPAPATEPEAEGAAASPRFRLASPFVLLAALLLLGGAAFSSLPALAGGWLIAYASRRLTPGEVKTAVLVIPGLAAASGVVWLWGRVEGRWGEPVTAGGEAMGTAISETWPWTLRGAAIASALYLLWRARRH
ncbi:hypothetical protein [Streptomyces sp. NPDC006477]|uniref:hypothetical protein n=1 Tax=Streptomyces sp. NPDC006477 TaxID=3364747 RepID=UPI0036799E27